MLFDYYSINYIINQDKIMKNNEFDTKIINQDKIMKKNEFDTKMKN